MNTTSNHETRSGQSSINGHKKTIHELIREPVTQHHKQKERTDKRGEGVRNLAATRARAPAAGTALAAGPRHPPQRRTGRRSRSSSTRPSPTDSCLSPPSTSPPTIIGQPAAGSGLPNSGQTGAARPSAGTNRRPGGVDSDTGEGSDPVRLGLGGGFCYQEKRKHKGRRFRRWKIISTVNVWACRARTHLVLRRAIWTQNAHILENRSLIKCEIWTIAT